MVIKITLMADGREVTLRGAEVLDLAKQLHGQLLLAGDAVYEEALFFSTAAAPARGCLTMPRPFAHRCDSHMMIMSGWSHGATDTRDHIEATRNSRRLQR